MQWERRTVTMPDGASLLVRQGAPPSSPRGTLLFIHGGGDHSGRYLHVVERLADRGWQCLLPDLRGHGESTGERWDIADCETYLDDLHLVLRAFSIPAAELYVFGHSFGGLLAVRWSQRGPQPRGLILSAPLLGLAIPVARWKLWLGRILLQIAPRTRFRSQLDPDNMTRDVDARARRKADPYLQRHVTARWFFAMQATMEAAQKSTPEICCPLLVFQGGADRTVVPQATHDWLDRTSSTDRTLIELPDHVHEVFNEADWARTTDIMTAWLNQRVDRRRD